MKRLGGFLVIAIAALGVVRAAPAQVPGAELTQQLVSREALQNLLAQYEQAAASTNLSGPVRAQARAQAAQVRQRLTDGDFNVGDRILLRVEAESLYNDTFTVRAGRNLELPVVGAISLQGVLRIELSDYLSTKLAQFIRNPKVHAQSLIRVTILGGVGHQGFFTVPVDITVNDLIMGVAGGVAQNAELEKFRIERGSERLYDGAQLEEVIAQGRTLDALSIRSGDRFVLPIQMPSQGRQGLFFIVQTINIALLALFSIQRLFNF